MNENAAQSGKNPRAQREQPGQGLVDYRETFLESLVII